MKIARALIASVIALSSLHLHAAETRIEVASAQQMLKQQYAELEDLKTQLELVKSGGEANTVTFIISSGLIAAGLIMDILSGPGTQIKNLATLSAADTVIIIGAVGATATGISLALDANKIQEIEKKINKQQTRIADTAKGLL